MKIETKYGKFALDVDDVDRFLVNQHVFFHGFPYIFWGRLPVTSYKRAKFHQHDELAAGAHQPENGEKAVGLPPSGEHLSVLVLNVNPGIIDQ